MWEKAYSTKSGLGTISILIGGIGNTVVTVFILSVIVWVLTSEVVWVVKTGLIF